MPQTMQVLTTEAQVRDPRRLSLPREILALKPMAAPSALLRAVILAACVAGAIAGAPSEEWAERLRLLETRVEQSEQREAEQLRLFETGIAQSKQREAALHKRVAFLEGTVQRLRPSSEQAEATAPKVRTGKAAVGPMGEPEAVGRRLNAPTCCRWTADGTCGTVPAERFEVCTHMHEYLETKTTTHEFADLDTCLGPDASKWSATFDGASSDVTLSYDAVVMTTLKTPLKVTHAADCSNVTPTLNVQMDTVLAHTLTLAEPGHVAIDVAARLRELGPYQDPNAWTLNSGQAWFLASGYQGMPTIQRNSDAETYYATANTNRPVSYMLGLRPPNHNLGHSQYCLTPTQGHSAISQTASKFGLRITIGLLKISERPARLPTRATATRVDPFSMAPTRRLVQGLPPPRTTICSPQRRPPETSTSWSSAQTGPKSRFTPIERAFPRTAHPFARARCQLGCNSMDS